VYFLYKIRGYDKGYDNGGYDNFCYTQIVTYTHSVTAVSAPG